MAPTLQSQPSLRPESTNSFRSFATFLRGYMGVMPLVTAAFAPLLTLSHAIPVYSQQAKSLATMSGLLGFLVVAWVFYSRHALAAGLFRGALEKIEAAKKKAAAAGVDPSRPNLGHALSTVSSALLLMTPFMLIVLSVVSYFRYNLQLEDSITIAQGQQIGRDYVTGGKVTTGDEKDIDYLALVARTPSKFVPPRSDILQQQNFEIPHGHWLTVYYLGIFLCAELAFVIMATREYLQSLLHISDQQIVFALTNNELIEPAIRMEN